MEQISNDHGVYSFAMVRVLQGATRHKSLYYHSAKFNRVHKTVFVKQLLNNEITVFMSTE